MKCCKECIHIAEKCTCEHSDRFEMSPESSCYGCRYALKRPTRQPCNQCIDNNLYEKWEERK